MENEEKLKKIKKYSRMLEKTFDWGCNDEAKALYANAVYFVITEDKTFEGSEEDFINCLLER